jgi:aminopeptidase N
MLKTSILALFALLTFTQVGYSQLKRYDVLSYTGTIELDRQDTFIRGHVKMIAVCTTGAPVTRILQHLIYLDIDSVLVDGIRSTIDWTGKDSGEYYVVPPESHLIPGYFTVETFYHGKPLPEQNTSRWGGVSNRNNMMFAMGVGLKAPYISCTRHWLPCYDLPDDKADSARIIFVSRNASDVITASGQLERVFDTLGGKAYDWHMIHPIASYLMTFAQGPFELMKIENPLNLQFEAYAFAADTAKMREVMVRRAVRGLEFFDSLYSPYPFEKVGYVVAPIGSMEHQTMITLSRLALDTNSTNAVHELSHMWFGDLVTCHTFDDPWLNEGFATFSESLYLERFEGKQAYRNRQWIRIKSAKDFGSDYPMYGAPYWSQHKNNYPEPVIYHKGAAVLGMLRYHLGDAIFFAGLQTYLNRFAYKTATSYDLWEHFENVAGQDLDWFFQKWVFEKGYPKFDVSYSTGKINKIKIKQSSTSGYFKLPIMVEGTMTTGEKRRQIIWTDSAEVSNYNLEFSGFETASLVFDPDSVLIADFTFSTLSVDETGARAIRAYPNPAADHLVIRNLIRGSIITLIDTGGKHWGSRYVDASAETTISLSGIPNGSYRLVIDELGSQSSHQVHSEQIIIQR